MTVLFRIYCFNIVNGGKQCKEKQRTQVVFIVWVYTCSLAKAITEESSLWFFFAVNVETTFLSFLTTMHKRSSHQGEGGGGRERERKETTSQVILKRKRNGTLKTRRKNDEEMAASRQNSAQLFQSSLIHRHTCEETGLPSSVLNRTNQTFHLNLKADTLIIHTNTEKRLT